MGVSVGSELSSKITVVEGPTPPTGGGTIRTEVRCSSSYKVVGDINPEEGFVFDREGYVSGILITGAGIPVDGTIPLGSVTIRGFVIPWYPSPWGGGSTTAVGNENDNFDICGVLRCSIGILLVPGLGFGYPVYVWSSFDSVTEGDKGINEPEEEEDSEGEGKDKEVREEEEDTVFCSPKKLFIARCFVLINCLR